MTPYDRCVAWVKERERVRIAKEVDAAPPPWTSDPIIGTYRFCNVRREDDRGTRWIKENIRLEYGDHPLLWLMLCAARQINWPATLEDLIATGAWYSSEDFTPEAMAAVLNERAGRGEKVFTGAYIITAPATKGAKKTDHVALKTLGALWRDRARFELDPPRTLEKFHTTLTKYDGWGPFLAYQAVVDMRFTPILEKAEDRDRWAAAGPGTIRGLNRLAERRVDYALPQWQALSELRKLWPKLQDDSGVEMDFSDVPNVMCETDKYLRVMNGEGKPRALYVPGRGA